MLATALVGRRSVTAYGHDLMAADIRHCEDCGLWGERFGVVVARLGWGVIVEGFDAWFAVEYPRVVAALSVAFCDRSLAEEAAQEGFARALRRWRAVAEADRPAAWVYVVAVRYGRREQRRERGRPSPAVYVDAADASQRVVDAVWLREVLGALSARQREAVVLRYLADLSVRDVARAMRCREGTVKSTLHAAMAALRVEADDDRSKEDQ